jgi:DNA polymerase/3'-5' exonuclease PolX
MTEKTRYPLSAALAVAAEIVRALEPACSRIVIAGSIRRQKPTVGDIEIVYVSKTCRFATGLFGEYEIIQQVDPVINGMLRTGEIQKRKNVRGSEMWGEKNKLARHTASGIAVDLFATSEECWANYLVCRTGGAETNTRIATEAQRRGLKWNPYGPGFTHLATGRTIQITTEADVFKTVGLNPISPEKRT